MIESDESDIEEPFEEDDSSDVACNFCSELYSQSKKGEMWIRCQECFSWCHTECAGVDRKLKMFTCDSCI